MVSSLIIFIRAIGLYAAITLPVIISPVIYVISMFYVITFGWFACALFMFCTVITVNVTSSYPVRMGVLVLAVPLSVAFAFQMIGVFGMEKNVWDSGAFLLFPIAATISGWISLLIGSERFAIPQPDRWRPGAKAGLQDTN